jgi:hypothetical protein
MSPILACTFVVKRRASAAPTRSGGAPQMVFGKSFGSTRKLKTGSRFILEHRAAEGPANERCHHKLEPVPGAALSLLPNKCSLSVGANPLQYFDWRFYFLVRVNDTKSVTAFSEKTSPQKLNSDIFSRI